MTFNPQKNALLAGRYEFERPVGEGGMGAVWRARDLRLQCPVAVKVLYHDGRDAEAMSQRFLREARVAAAVQHANVVRTTDFGIEDGTPYMVMELVEGESLADRMGKLPALSIHECLDIVSSVLRGLAAAHDAGVIHRDVKPENVHLVHDRDGVFPKILDFGIASAVKPGGRVSVQTTQAGGLVGTPHYMSPEQARGLPDLDARSDVYSVGAMLYEMLTGSTPVDADLPGDLLLAVVKEPHRPAVELREEIGEALSYVLDISLRKSRDERYPSARAMRQALLAAAPPQTKSRADVTGPIQIRRRLSSVPPHRNTGRPTLDAEELLSGEMLPLPESPRRRPLWIAGAVLGVSLLVAGGIVVGTNASAPEPEAATRPSPAVEPAEERESADSAPAVSPVQIPTQVAAPPPAESAEAEEAETVATAPEPTRTRRRRAGSPSMATMSAMTTAQAEMSSMASDDEAMASGDGMVSGEGMATPAAFRDLDY